MPVVLFDDDPERKKGWLFCTEALKRGVFLHPAHTMFLSAAHSDADIDRALAATDEAMREVAANSDERAMRRSAAVARCRIRRSTA